MVEILLNQEMMPQTLQDRLIEKISMQGFIQLSVLIGWCRMIASLVVAFEFPLPKE